MVKGAQRVRSDPLKDRIQTRQKDRNAADLRSVGFVFDHRSATPLTA